MVKNISIYTVCLVCLIIYSALEVSAIEEIEPNNSLETAQQITLPITISGVADSEDREDPAFFRYAINDLFAFTLSQASNINAHLQIKSEVPKDGVELHLYNGEGTYIIYWGRTEDDKIDGTAINQYIKKPLPAGTYYLGVFVASDSASYDIDIETSLIPETTSFVSITGPIIKLVYQPTVLKQFIYGINFLSASKCHILNSDKSLVRIKPKSFSLDSIKNKQLIKFFVPHKTIKRVLREQSGSTVFDVDVICENGAVDKKTLGLFAYSDFTELLDDFLNLASGCRVCLDLKLEK